MTPITRGFGGHRREVDPERIPPGQYVVEDFPVLSAGPTPRTALGDWSFAIDGVLDAPRSWAWEEFTALRSETFTVDIHCVTKWSKLGTSWTGVSLDTLLEGVQTPAAFVTAWSDGGYTTNLPLADLTGGRAGSCTPSRAGRWSPNTAVPPGCSCHTCTSGRARSGCAA